MTNTIQRLTCYILGMTKLFAYVSHDFQYLNAMGKDVIPRIAKIKHVNEYVFVGITFSSLGMCSLGTKMVYKQKILDL